MRPPTPPSPPRPSRESGVLLKVLLGIALVVFGVALLASNLGWFDLRFVVIRFWPTMMIVAGLVILVQHRQRASLWGFVLLFWGLWIYADQLGLIRVNFWAVFGPTILVLLGGSLVWRALGTRPLPRGEEIAANAHVRTFAMLSGSEVKSQGSAPFHGAELTAVMGGVKLDLIHAQVDPGVTPVVDVFSLMGGIEIHVPRDWEVVNQVTPVMGACVDKRHPATNPGGKRIMVRGVAIFGGVEIKD